MNEPAKPAVAAAPAKAPVAEPAKPALPPIEDRVLTLEKSVAVLVRHAGFTPVELAASAEGKVPPVTGARPGGVDATLAARVAASKHGAENLRKRA